MEMKRIYKDTSQQIDPRKPNGGLEVDHVQVRRLTKTQKFTQRVLDKGFIEGFISIGNGQIIIKSQPDDIVYNIIRRPGYYCCHDDCLLEDEQAAKKYVSDNYAGAESPDSNNPAGYRKDNFYFCELVEG